MAPAVEVCPVRLPGREMRLREPAIADFSQLLDALAHALAEYTSEPYALFGHSMGASLAYELTLRFLAAGRPGPRHLFVSGRQAPHLLRDVLSRPVYELQDAELARELSQVSGASAEVLRDPDLASLVLPVLRADFAVCQSYRPTLAAPLAAPITAFGATGDASVVRADIEGWRERTRSGFSLHMLPGDHLFLLSAAPQIWRAMLQELVGPLESSAA